MDLPKQYVSKDREESIAKSWEEKGIFKFTRSEKKKVYSIDTPPPTVSGNMHIGHAFSYSQQDFIARYKRMKGFNVYYPFGTDDNGLPTERMVEKIKNVKSTRMPRQEFVSLCRNTIKEIKDDFISDWKRIGMSCDFTKPYSTIDEHSVRTSQYSFIDLYKKELVYRKSAPSIWCVTCQTAIAQAELEDKELSSTFNFVKFKLKNKKDIIIATTRPELLPACVCIFVHPDDERYKSIIGETAIVPIFNQEVKIYSDASANPEKGTGILMICSYGDRFDVEAIQKHNLVPRVCINRDGKLNNLAKQFEGLNIKDARKGILEELALKGLLESKKDIKHTVNVHDKCGTEIEFLATEQWFIKVIENKDKFLEAGNEINWHPQGMKARYDNWVKNLNWDWCISRQRHFGVPFPVWYNKKDGSVVLASEEDIPIDPLSNYPKHLPKGVTKDDLIPEKDVMDTWATSSVSPQIILNWVNDNDFRKDVNVKEMFPTSLRPQAHDIIRTWAFYTIVKGIYHQNEIPWKDIIISGNVSDPKGEKMSKSKGNVVYPRQVIEKYSADALRFWAAGSKLGEDLAYLEKDLVTGQKFVTKLWNASSFSLMHLKDYKKETPKEIYVVDAWLLSKLNKVIREASDTFENYEYSKTKSETEKFFWQIFCDNYLEIIKDRMYNPSNWNENEVNSAKYTLYTGLLTVLKLMAPITPFITEEIYQLFYKDKERIESIHLTKWPDCDKNLINDETEKTGDILVDIISATRKFKSTNKMSLKQEIEELTVSVQDSNLRDEIEKVKKDLAITTNTKRIVFSNDDGTIKCDNFNIFIGIKIKQ